MNKRIIISESEKNEIKQLYNINEGLLSSLIDIDSLKSKIENLGNEKSDDSKSGDTKTNDTKTDDDTNTDDDYLNKTSSGSVDEKWMKVTKKVIDKFEGGYWNGRNTTNVEKNKMGICSNHPTASSDLSTETMFGLDRYNGNIEAHSTEGKQFFALIDKQKKELGMDKFCKKWKWLYRGGDLEEKLKTLAAKIMKKSYDRNVGNFVSPELKKRIENNDRLLMHFSYASWNGPWFFQQFAKSLNQAVKEGKSDKELLKIAIKNRKDSKLRNQHKVAEVLTDPNLNLT